MTAEVYEAIKLQRLAPHAGFAKLSD